MNLPVKAPKTEQRMQKLTAAARLRQHSLHVIMENIHDPHNVSAIFRSCDAVGVPDISLLYTVERFPKLNRTSSASAVKWVRREKYKNVDDCYSALREQGFKIYASSLAETSVDLYSLDFTGKTAIVVGNEHRGVSEEAAAKADGLFYIPMMGIVQSLNVSVATAVILYEALRQRMDKGMYKDVADDEKFRSLMEEWCRK